MSRAGSRMSVRLEPEARQTVADHARDEQMLPAAAYTAAILAFCRDPKRSWLTIAPDAAARWPMVSIYPSEEAAQQARLLAHEGKRDIRDVVNSAMAAEATRIRKLPKKPIC